MKVQGKAVLILPDPMPEKTKGGLAIPKTAKEGQTKGTVVDCGSECEEVHKGDRVIFLKKPTSIIVIGDVEHCFGMESCIQFIY